MSKPLKILAGLLVLLLAAPVILILVVDPNQYKPAIEAYVSEATGRRLSIDGDISLSFFPWLGLEVAGASLSNAPGFGAEPLVQVGRVTVRAPILPLIAGRLEADRLRIEALRLNLIRDEGGRTNWDFPGPARHTLPSFEPEASRESGGAAIVEAPARMPPPETRAAVPEPAAPPPAPGPERAAIAPTYLAGIEIVKARVYWDDRQIGQHLILDGLDVTSGPIAAGQPIDLRLSGGLRDAGDRFQARLAAESRLIPGTVVGGFGLRPVTLRVESLRTANGLAGDGELSASLAGNLADRRYSIDGLEMKFSARGDALGGGRLDGELAASAALDLRDGTLEVDRLAVHSGGLVASATARGRGLLSSPVYEGNLALDEIDLRAWMAQHGLPVPNTPDPATFRRAALTTDWSLDRERIDFRDFVLKLDQSHIAGEIGILRAHPTLYRFELTIDALDLDRYLPATVEPGQAGMSAEPPQRVSEFEAAVEGGASDSDARAEEQRQAAAHRPAATPEPASSSRQALTLPDLDGRLRIAELKAARLTFGDAALVIRAEGGQLGCNNQVGRFYQGRLEGRLGLELTKAAPKFTLVEQATGIQIGSLLGDLTGEGRLTGRADLSADVSASGLNAGALTRSLGGKLGLHVSQGAVKGFSLERLIREAEARLKGKPAPSGLPLQTEFSELSASAVAKDGVLSNQDLVVRSDYLHVTGKGKIDIGERRMDYRFEPTFVDPPRGRGIKELEDIPIPVRLSGTFDQPKWDVDVGGALRELARRKLDEQGGNLLKKLEERTGIKGLEQGIRGLFGR